MVEKIWRIYDNIIQEGPMRPDGDAIGEMGLQFFGKISASISHEIRNALAIINESAGLLEDLVTLPGRGKPLNPERLTSLAQQVRRQIKRADGIIDKMNRFAHSVDEPVKDIDLKKIVELVSSLCQRFATMRKVTLTVEGDETPLVIRTNPFLLENFIYLCLDFAMATVGEGKTVVLVAEAADGGAKLRFGGFEALGKLPPGQFPGRHEKALLETLKAGLTMDLEAGEVLVTLPKEGTP
jgi:phosphoglycerate-specific signal transduction histidine kinase